MTELLECSNSHFLINGSDQSFLFELISGDWQLSSAQLVEMKKSISINFDKILDTQYLPLLLLRSSCNPLATIHHAKTQFPFDLMASSSGWLAGSIWYLWWHLSLLICLLRELISRTKRHYQAQRCISTRTVRSSVRLVGWLQIESRLA